MTTTADAPGNAPTRAERTVQVESTRAPIIVPIVSGGIMVGAVIAGGVALRFIPGQNALDTWGFSTFPPVQHSDYLSVVIFLGLLPVDAFASFLVGALAWGRDRRRALACVGGPALAVLLAQVLKVAVGRRYLGAVCFPSGTAADVAAVATALVLATRRVPRILAVLLGSALTIAEAIAIVQLRWHYPSDALGGVALGIGTVVLVDVALHRLWLRPRRRLRRVHRAG